MAAPDAITIFYVPADCGSVMPGKAKAPQAFRDVGIVQQLLGAGVSVTERLALESPVRYQILPPGPNGVRNEESNALVCRRVHDTLREAWAGIDESSYDRASTCPTVPFSLVLGGGCDMLPGVMSAYRAEIAQLETGLVYVDADLDLTSPTDAESTGVLASMTMAHLLGRPGTLQSIPPYAHPDDAALCHAGNTVFFGTNMQFAGNTRSQLASLLDEGFKIVSSAAVARDAERSAEDVLRHLTDKGIQRIVVHLDVDSIDPRLFPLAHLPNYTGVDFEHMMSALAVLLADDRVVALSVAEVNPDHDPDLDMVGRLTKGLVAILAARKSR